MSWGVGIPGCSVDAPTVFVYLAPIGVREGQKVDLARVGSDYWR